jgi:hypothetical protein
VSLVARLLEANGIPTVILGSAIDIVEHCGVPRFLFSDFPLGNPCGKPWETGMQRAIVSQALEMFDKAEGPRTTEPAPFAWGSDDWRDQYMKIRPEDLAELKRKGEENRRRREKMKAEGKL